MSSRIFLFMVVALVAGCGTSPTGRSQLLLFPEEQIAEMGVASYQQIKQQTPSTENSAVKGYVQCVADAITDEVEGDTQWEVTVFEDKAANAFALPGGKIGVYTGLLDVAENQNQLAAVLGHEVAHVLANHGNARVSTAFATNAGLTLIGIAAGADSSEQRQLLGLLGLGAQVGILLPFSRGQETEADVLGLQLMSKAGFDPRQSVNLWQNMAEAGGGQPPEFLSTHPAHGTRIETLKSKIPEVLPLYQQAQASGETPDCGPAPR